MKQKGFTLIELIAMVVVLGVLMAISVPNIAGILKNNRENIVKEDVSKMVGNAKTKIKIKQAQYPKSEGQCVVMSMGFVDNNNDLKEGINGGKYDHNESFVVIRKEKQKDHTYIYRFYVRIVEESTGARKYEIPLTEHNELSKNAKKYLTNKAPTITVDLKNAVPSTVLENVKNMGLDCTTINNIYTS